ncbi:uncharacterized protein [Oscarella lobularis]|uniref:uncharacterized protein n=1 Tax=Oscarella lobularis TaxID=121494 RepID=UPI003313B603
MGRRTKSKRAGFRGTPSYVMKAKGLIASRATVSSPAAASEPVVSSVPPAGSGGPSQIAGSSAAAGKLSSIPPAWNQTVAAMSQSGSVDTSALDEPHYRIVNIATLLKAMTAFLVCKSCHSADFTIKEDYSRRKGFCSQLVFYCKSCESNLSFPTSELRSGVQGTSHDVNRRAVLAALSMGCGRADFHRFCGIFNMPPLFLPDSWNNHMSAIAHASDAVFQQSASHAVQDYRRSKTAQDGEVIDAAVTFDGTWAKRGYSSHYGVQAALLNGRVIDFQMLCTYCKSCQRMEESGVDKDSVVYLDWYRKHLPICRKNYNGSSASMEAQGAVDIFGRSAQKHNLRYTTFIGDGDSKAYFLVKDMYGEDHEVKKIDCVGHVHKRMGANLRNWLDTNKKVVMEDLGRVSGSGRLTKMAINRLSTYYGYAIKRNLGNVERMKKDILAVLYHSCLPRNAEDTGCKQSTKTPSEGHVFQHDTCPHSVADQHQYCPEGEDSWCRWQSDQATNENRYHQSRCLPHCFFHELLPIFRRLSDEDLLDRCKDGYTQNANESFHSTLWSYVPKSKYRGPLLILAGTRIAAAQFNHGSKVFVQLLKEMKSPPGKFSVAAFTNLDEKRIASSNQKATAECKKRRVIRKERKAKRHDSQRRTEDLTYEAGAFGRSADDKEVASPPVTASRGGRKGKKLATTSKRGRALVVATESSSEDETDIVEWHYTDYSSSDEDETAEQVDDSSRADNTSEPESSTSEVIVASYEDFDDDSDSSFRGFIVESLESGVLLSDKSGDSD